MSIDRTPAESIVAPPSSGQQSADSALESAVLRTMAYSDVFGYAPRGAEVHRYLHGVAADAEAVNYALATLVERGAIEAREDLFALQGRNYLFDQRRIREQIAAQLWPRARRYARWLATIPTVRLVGVTGSLAAGNPADAADIDFMLIVDGGTVWRSRAIAKLLQSIDARFGGSMCVNYFRSNAAYRLPLEDLYTARELTQMVPLYGLDAYAELRQENSWTQSLLPNASGLPTDIEPVQPSRIMRAASRPLIRSRAGQGVENWERARKIPRYNDTNFLPGEFSQFSAEATGHRVDIKKTINSAYESRISSTHGVAKLRLLIAQAYHLHFDPKLWQEMRPYPPLGSLYAASAARQAGFDVSFFDSMLATEFSGWISALDRNRPDVVVLFEDNFNYLTKMCLSNMRDAAVRMIGAAKRIGARIAVCSSDATDHAELYLDAGADFVLRGEGEAALLQLLDWLAQDAANNVETLPGISYRDAAGKIVSTKRLPAMRKLDELSFPAWDLVNLKRYAKVWRHRHGHVSINLATTRGCPYHCNWCSKPIWGQGYNVRSPANVANEIAWLRDLTDLDHVWFMDDIFGLKPRWVERFADCLEERQLKIRFKCLTRPDLLRREGEIEALARAGCETIWIGAESGSQKILDAMEKGTSVQQIEDITIRLKQAGIRVGYFVQFGYPGETLADIRKTVALIRRMVPDELGVSVSYPLPGTKFYERVKDQLGETANWKDSDDLSMLFRGPYRTRFYRTLHRHVHRALAWQRIATQLRNGELRSLSLWRRARRLAFFATTTLRLPIGWLGLYALSLVPNRGVAPLPVVLDQEAAARPSPQGD